MRRKSDSDWEEKGERRLEKRWEWGIRETETGKGKEIGWIKDNGEGRMEVI